MFVVCSLLQSSLSLESGDLLLAIEHGDVPAADTFQSVSPS